eukprot:12615116-Heterocapsa_arctica.AAC.1
MPACERAPGAFAHEASMYATMISCCGPIGTILKPAEAVARAYCSVRCTSRKSTTRSSDTGFCKILQSAATSALLIDDTHCNKTMLLRSSAMSSGCADSNSSSELVSLVLFDATVLIAPHVTAAEDEVVIGPLAAPIELVIDGLHHELVFLEGGHDVVAHVYSEDAPDGLVVVRVFQEEARVQRNGVASPG